MLIAGAGPAAAILVVVVVVECGCYALAPTRTCSALAATHIARAPPYLLDVRRGVGDVREGAVQGLHPLVAGSLALRLQLYEPPSAVEIELDATPFGRMSAHGSNLAELKAILEHSPRLLAAQVPASEPMRRQFEPSHLPRSGRG